MKQFIFMMTLCPLFTFGQQSSDYGDVAVIINDNSQVSMDIGNYFQQKRNIPSLNMIHISCSTAEEIDSAEFESIRQQIEAYLNANGLVDSINYIVTTKGVPLKVNRPGSPDPSHPDLHSSSVDSELTLILSSAANLIALNSFAINPYFEADSDFNRSDFGIYLVTRLTGYDVQDVYDMIDRSGPNTGVNQISSQFVFDIAFYTNQMLIDIYSYTALEVVDSLNTKNWLTTFDSSYNMLTNQPNVAGYFAIIGSVPVYQTGNSWTEGSIAYLGNDFASTTFDPNHSYSNTAFLADLIAEGATGGVGTAYYSYLSNVTNGNHIFRYYSDTSAEFNLAESIYANINGLSTWWIVVGDPKSSITIDNLASISPQTSQVQFKVYPNPIHSGDLEIEGQNIESVSLYSLDGRLAAQTFDLNPTKINISHLAGGTYIVSIKQDGIFYQQKIIKQ